MSYIHNYSQIIVLYNFDVNAVLIVGNLFNIMDEVFKKIINRALT